MHLAISDIMTKDLKTCTQDTSIIEVAKMMAEFDCGAIPVVDSNRQMLPIGIITDRDIVRRSTAKGIDPRNLLVRNCMTDKCFTVPVHETVSESLKIMESMQVRRLLVVSDLGVCVGLISQADISTHCTDGKIATLLRSVSRPKDNGSETREFVSEGSFR